MQVHTVPFDKVFVELGNVRDGTNTAMKIQERKQIDIYRAGHCLYRATR